MDSSIDYTVNRSLGAIYNSYGFGLWPWLGAQLLRGIAADINAALMVRSAAARLKSILPSVTESTNLDLTLPEALVAKFVHLPRPEAVSRPNLGRQLLEQVIPSLLVPPVDPNMPARGVLLHDPKGVGETCLRQVISGLVLRGQPPARQQQRVTVLKLDAGVVAAACEASYSILLSDVSSRKSLMAAVFRLAQRLSPCVIIMDKPQELPDFMRAAFIKEWHNTAASVPPKGTRRPFVTVVVRSAVPFTSLAPLFARQPIPALEQLVPPHLRLNVTFDMKLGRFTARPQPPHLQAAAAGEVAVAAVRQAWMVAVLAPFKRWLNSVITFKLALQVSLVMLVIAA